MLKILLFLLFIFANTEQNAKKPKQEKNPKQNQNSNQQNDDEKAQKQINEEGIKLKNSLKQQINSQINPNNILDKVKRIPKRIKLKNEKGVNNLKRECLLKLKNCNKLLENLYEAMKKSKEENSEKNPNPFDSIKEAISLAFMRCFNRIPSSRNNGKRTQDKLFKHIEDHQDRCEEWYLKKDLKQKKEEDKKKKAIKKTEDDQQED